MTKLIVLTLYELIVAGVTVLVAATILDFLNRAGGRLILRVSGRRVYLAVTAASTVLHELSHAIMCLFFLHRIEHMEIFSFDPVTGRSGFVQHRWDTGSLYQEAGNFFIGIAPMIAGVPLLLLSWAACGIRTGFALGYPMAWSGNTSHWTGSSIIRYVMAPLLSGITDLFTVHNLINPYFCVYLPVAFVICRAMAPSLPDLRGSGTGAAAVGVLMFLANVVAFFFGHNPWGFLGTIVAVSSAILHAVGSAIALSLFFAGILLALRLAGGGNDVREG
jgi:hypothetical protein